MCKSYLLLFSIFPASASLPFHEQRISASREARLQAAFKLSQRRLINAAVLETTRIDSRINNHLGFELYQVLPSEIATVLQARHGIWVFGWPQYPD